MPSFLNTVRTLGFLGGFLSTLVMLPTFVAADSHSGSTNGVDEDALASRIAEQVMEQLKQGEFLQEQIQLGIQNYIREQREAQAQAQADQGRAAARRAEGVRRVSVDRDHIYGNTDARVSIIEYSDFECPFCKRFHSTPKQVIEAYGGEVNWVYRHFPLEFHNPLAQKEAEASECAGELGGNDGFWRYADEVYARTKSNGKGFPLDGLVPLAAELGFDEAAFGKCMEEERYAQRVKEDLEEGQSIGISGTPGNVILDNQTGNVRLVAGAASVERMRSEIDALVSASE